VRAADRTAGLLLITGFVFMIPGVAFAVSSQTGSDLVPATFDARAGAILLAVTLILTLAGLVLFDTILWRSRERVLPTLGTAAYVVAVAAWLAATVHALTAHRWTYALEVTYIVAAGCAMLAFGAAVVRAGAPARWVGWAATGWSAGALILFALPSENYPPLLVQFVPLLLGIALVRAGGRARQHGLFETATGSS
jgi:hypothetical protein